MNATFLYAFQGEWLKRKRSLSSWLVIVGGFFTPAVVIVARLVKHDTLERIYSGPSFWTALWKSSWESMAIFFLPMGAILLTTLMSQIEFKNNAWKQVHALPIGLATIFFSKLAVVLLMMVQFFVLFNVGIYLSALIPWLLVRGVPYPKALIPWAAFAQENILYFVDCLPIIAVQFLLGVRFRNFLVPVGAGFVLWVGALSALPWKFGFLVPYTYCMLNYLKDDTRGKVAVPLVNIHWMAIGYFVLFTLIGFCLFVTKREKG